MTSDTGVTKEEEEEEDDTMQNTVVLFSNTDKFVLLQVQLECVSNYLYFGVFAMLNTAFRSLKSSFVFVSHFLMNCLFYFRTCASCVAVLEKVLRGSYWLVHNVPSVTILIASTAK